MVLFVDTSVILAASGSPSGASFFLFQQLAEKNWSLITSPWCTQETLNNIEKLGASSVVRWRDEIEPLLKIVPNALTLDKLLVFPKTKDRPVVLSALAADASILLTLDRKDFQDAVGESVYGLKIKTPGQFLIQQRMQGLL